MDESDRLSTAAIAIALIALIILFGQFIQQLLGTADGYRRCKRLDRSRKLGMVQPIVRNDRLVHGVKCHERKLRREFRKSFWAYLISLWSNLTYNLTSKRKRQAKVDEVEKGQLGVLTQLPYMSQIRERQIRKASEAVEETVCARDDQSADQELLVNWVPFLKALHQDHVQQWPGECKCSPVADQKAWMEALDVSFRGYVNIPDRSMPMLFLRERSWDFMPPDVVRPVASIQVRALIVLAMRLGMQWSGLDLKTEGGMSAQGNGFYLSSVSLRGLGTVMQFGSDGRTARELGYIPTMAADKLLCGILPGCGDLCPEVKIVGDDRTQSLIGNFYEVLGLPEDIRQGLAIPEYRNRLEIREHVYKRMMINDAMILFVPFLPEEMYTSVYCYFYAWAGQSQTSTFWMWETRGALLVQSRKRMKALKELPKDHRLRYVEECLGHVEKDYELDFYHRFPGSLIHWGPDEVRTAFKEGGPTRLREKRRKFLSCLRGIFKQTQIYFDRLQSGNFAEKIPDHHIKYVDLVSANIELCYFAGEEARKRCESGKAKHVFDFRIRPWKGLLECYEATSCSVEFLDHNEHGLFASLRRKGCEMSNLKMEEAWWMLMLRGLVWSMSCSCQNPGAPIPSSFYDNQRPVWMM